MKSYIVFHKDDNYTPPISLEELENKKYLDYGITEEDINDISDRFKRNLTGGIRRINEKV